MINSAITKTTKKKTTQRGRPKGSKNKPQELKKNQEKSTIQHTNNILNEKYPEISNCIWSIDSILEDTVNGLALMKGQLIEGTLNKLILKNNARILTGNIKVVFCEDQTKILNGKYDKAIMVGNSKIIDGVFNIVKLFDSSEFLEGLIYGLLLALNKSKVLGGEIEVGNFYDDSINSGGEFGLFRRYSNNPYKD